MSRQENVSTLETKFCAAAGAVEGDVDECDLTGSITDAGPGVEMEEAERIAWVSAKADGEGYVMFKQRT